MIGKRIRHFEIQSAIGSGGQGTVYLAWDTQLHREVAIKVMDVGDAAPNTTPRAGDELLREARAAARIQSSHIAQVFEIFQDEGRAHLVMELLDGGSLRSRLKEGPLPPEEMSTIAREIATGLADAHRQGVLHRDMKPENVLFTHAGVAKITDFGLAKIVNTSNTTRAAGIFGTAAYLPPEMLEGNRTDARGDVYSTGVIFFEMIVGHPPFTGDNFAALCSAILHASPEDPAHLRPDAPASLVTATKRMIERNPASRFADAVEVADFLKSTAEVPRGRFDVRNAWKPALAVLLAAAVGWAAFTVRKHLAAPGGPVVLTGVVVDRGGHPVSGARVTVDGYPFSSQTTSRGEFGGELPDVTPGDEVTLRVTSERFATHTERIRFRNSRSESTVVVVGTP